MDAGIWFCVGTGAAEAPGIVQGGNADFSVARRGVKQRSDWTDEEVTGVPGDVERVGERGAIEGRLSLLSSGVDEQRTLKVIPPSSSSSSSSHSFLHFSAAPFSRSAISLGSSPSSSSSMSDRWCTAS